MNNEEKNWTFHAALSHATREDLCGYLELIAQNIRDGFTHFSGENHTWVCNGYSTVGEQEEAFIARERLAHAKENL